MTDDDQTSRRWLLDVTPLQDSPAYARFWWSGIFAGVGAQLGVVAIGIHVYDLTGSTTAVAAVGGFALLPMLLVGVLGGSIVDAHDRRIVLFIATSAQWVTVAALTVLAWTGVDELVPYYVLTTLGSMAGTLVGTARFAIHPRLVPMEQLPAVAALSGVSAGVQAAAGPALAGVLITAFGVAWTLSFDTLLAAAAFIGILSLPPIRPATAVRLGPQALKDGFAFLAKARNIRTAFAFQLIVFTFGRPQALFPAVSVLLIGGGPITVGLLSAAGAVGVIVSGLLSGRLGTVRWHGRAIGVSTIVVACFVAAFGVLLAIVSFDPGTADAPVVPALVIGCVLLAGAGAADNIGGIFRTTMLQMSAPDTVRGRVQGFFTLILTAGPRLGDVFVGVVAAIGALWWPPLLGGAVMLVIAALLLRFSPTFRAYDALEPTP